MDTFLNLSHHECGKTGIGAYDVVRFEGHEIITNNTTMTDLLMINLYHCQPGVRYPVLGCCRKH